MARRLRIQFQDAIYHVMSRGDRRESIFLDDRDRSTFLKTLEQTCRKTDWRIHAFTLMPNHFHLVPETPKANLAAGMKWLLGTYTSRFNRRHGLTGHLFAGRYKSIVVGDQGGYVRTVCDYVHLNPARAKLITSDTPLRQYKWSSFPIYCADPNDRPKWLEVRHLLAESGIESDTRAGRLLYEKQIEWKRTKPESQETEATWDDWCLAAEAYRKELLAKVGEKKGRWHYGPELAESDEAKAIQILEKELTERSLTLIALKKLPKGHEEKVAIAQILRKETTMTLDWISDRLKMGSRTYLGHLLYWKGKKARKRRKKQQSAKTQSAQSKYRSGSAKPITSDQPSSPTSNKPKDNSTILLTDPI